MSREFPILEFDAAPGAVIEPPGCIVAGMDAAALLAAARFRGVTIGQVVSADACLRL